jgi:biotin-(acetyl-CoA carboxylase) ligase
MALAVAEAIESFSEDLKGRVRLKWINDIYVDNMKIAGVLCKASSTSSAHEQVVGIGVNLNSSPKSYLN